jgi:hypothetical protein
MKKTPAVDNQLNRIKFIGQSIPEAVYKKT